MREYHVIKMVRSANIRNISESRSKSMGADAKEERCHTFLMLDYFDCLFHVKLADEEQDYETFLGMNEHLWGAYDKPDISRRILELYTNENSENDIFKVEATGEALSKQPFLGLIQIGITPQYFRYLCKTGKSISESLRLVRKDIELIMAEKGIRFQIFHALTSGDVYAVIRTESLAKIYQTAIAIGRLHQNDKEKKPLWKYTTYTNVGIECVFQGGKALSFASDYVEEHKEEKFAFRFSVAPEIHEVIQSVQNKYGITGLFGRYDYSVTLTMEMFAVLYPDLCIYKGPGIPQKLESFNLEKAKCVAENSFPQLMKYGLDTHQIKILNERALVGARSDFHGIDEAVDWNKAEYEKITRKNREQEEKYHALEQLGFGFVRNRNGFKDIYRALGELIHAYSSLGYETDSRLNWNQYSYLIDVLFDNIKYYQEIMNKIPAESGQKKEEMQGYFLESFRDSVEAINHYVRFIQSMNQQTFQAPVYEIQTRVDAEKLFIAYMEFMKEYLQEYCTYDWSACEEKLNKEKRNNICPIIYPNLTNKNVSVISPFNTGKEKDEFDMGNQDVERTLLMLCRIPSFEYFGRFYEMIPLVLHEMSHHILILERKTRNEFIIHYIIRGVVRELVHIWVMQHSRDKILDNYGRLEEDLVEVFSCYYADDFKTNRCSNWETCKIYYLEEMLGNYLSRLGSGFGGINWEETVQVPQNIKRIVMKYLLEYVFQQDGDITEDIEAVKKMIEQWSLEDGLSLIFRLRRQITECFHQRVGQTLGKTSGYQEERQQLTGVVNKFELSDYDLVQPRLVLEQRIEELCEKTLEILRMYPKNLADVVKAEMKSYAFHMLKLSDLVHMANKIEEGIGTAEVEEDKGLKDKYWERLSGILDSYKDSSHGKAYFCDLDVTQYANELGADFKDKEKVFENWKQHARQVDGAILRSFALRNFDIYRETCADVIMSCAMGFSAFGYMNFAVNTMVSMHEVDVLEAATAINIERFKLVVAVLMPEDKLKITDTGYVFVNCKELREAFGKYMLANVLWGKNVMEESIKRLPRTNSDEKEFEKFRDKINEFFADLKLEDALIKCSTEKDAEQIQKYLSDAFGRLNDTILKAWSKEPDSVRTELWRTLNRNKQRIERQGVLWLIVNRVIGQEGYFVEKDIQMHLKKIFDSIKKESRDESCVWQKSKHASIVKISDFYNMTDGINRQNKREMLESTIQFIEDYYYQNRFFMAGKEAK